ncbi:hypothetical protein [Streptomyces sp. NPDC000188]
MASSSCGALSVLDLDLDLDLDNMLDLPGDWEQRIARDAALVAQ